MLLKLKNIPIEFMLNKTRIGVCVEDHMAYLLEEKNEENVITIIEAQPSDHNHAFLKKVYEIVKHFDKIFLFGPANIKNKLIGRIRANTLRIEIMNDPVEGKITDNQKIDFINQYFEA